jgi:hypothetical protein
MILKTPDSPVSILPVFLVLLFTAACSNTKVTSAWKAPDASTLAQGNKILVIGIIQDKDIRLRMQMEGFLVDALKAKGYAAVSSYTLYGPKMFGGKNEESALGQLHDSNIDEVFTISLLDKAHEKSYRQPDYGNPYSPFWGYYSYMYGRPYSPGYVAVNTRFYWESNLYDVGSKKLLYSVQSESFNPSSAASMGKTYGRVVVKSMTKEGLVVVK